MCGFNDMKVLTVKPIPVPAKWKHPPPPNDALPKHEFTMGLIAPKGAGKTTVICNLLNFYKGYFHNILVFSPTVASDEKWDWVKEQKLLVQNRPLIDFVNKQKKKEMNGIVEEVGEESSIPSFDVHPLVKGGTKLLQRRISIKGEPRVFFLRRSLLRCAFK